jgi:hypothetical protein
MEAELYYRLAVLTLLGLALDAEPAAAAGKLYGNARFGFFIEVPTVFSVADPEPENGDGRRFHKPDQSAELTASGGWIIEDNFANEVAQEKGFAVQHGWKLTYESKVAASSAAYSGQKGERIFYEREIATCNGQAHAAYRLEYPSAEKAKYDGMIKALSASLKAGIGSCG